MTNPYQPPRSPSRPEGSPDFVGAEFLLTRRMLRYAESKFLLYRCGGRLTLASLVMIALSFAVCFDWPTLTQVSVMLRQIGVMGLATVVYLALIYQVRMKIRRRLSELGFVPDSSISIEVTDHAIRWTNPAGRGEVPLSQLRLMPQLRGMIVAIERDCFLYIPRSAEFGAAGYPPFAKRLKEAVNAG